jgi:diaminohydroxyphosphoribosylaminopyrimidine deaminase/5-amino-6-(5-phosphoribosylamino)uracil reductase
VATSLTATHERWMQHALALARRGEGRTRPNPPVGAVVIKRGRVIGEGYHHKAGQPHAEVEALTGLGARAKGATLYVTLEPCCTHGRTPPCTELIIQNGISQVVVSVRDPNPDHSGRGLRKLRVAGIKVITGVCREEGKSLLAPFAKWITTARPYVSLKMGMTLDGRIADPNGISRWITGPAARREVRRLRKRADAILVGAGTAVTDDPSLRWSTVASRNPKRVIVDSTGRLSPRAQVFTDGQAQNTIVATTGACPARRVGAYESAGAEVWRCGRGSRVNLESLIVKLGKAGILHVLCEGGGELAAQLIQDRLVDVFEFFVAPRLLGGGGCPVVGGRGWTLRDGPELSFLDSRRVGHDIWIRAAPVGNEAEIQKAESGI